MGEKKNGETSGEEKPAVENTEQKKSGKKPETKPPKPKETPLVELFPDEPALLKVFKKANIKTVEQLKQLGDDELLQIPGIQQTRLGKIRVALGKPRYPVQENK